MCVFGYMYASKCFSETDKPKGEWKPHQTDQSTVTRLITGISLGVEADLTPGYQFVRAA